MPVIKQLGIQPGLTPEYIRRERDLIKQINDALAGQDATFARILAEPVCFAFATGTTDGAGGIVANYTYGCTMDVEGTSVVMRFTERRPSTEYTYGGMQIRGAGIAQHIVSTELARQTVDACGIVYRTEAGVNFSAATNVVSTLMWAIGPRASRS